MTAAKRPLGPLPPGSTIGILGSGQLARMLSMAAARLGLKCRIYADATGPASDVVVSEAIAPYDDAAALAAFAATVDVVTFEFENVPDITARTLEKHVIVRPGPRAFAIAQDRLAEKTFIKELGIAVAPYHAVTTADEAAAALKKLKSQAILKTARMGYDGKGQLRLKPGDDAASAFASLGGVPCVLEKRLAFAQEISVIAVRAVDGAVRTYDIPQNLHEAGILRRCAVPAPLPEDVATEARRMASDIAEGLDYVGVLAVEMFDLGPKVAAAKRLVVNEIAPRVHNSGHWTIDACPVCQFENHIRAVADWPLGSTERHSDAEMHNLIGDQIRAWREIASDHEVAFHHYAKRDVRDGRKMGHTTRLFPKGTRASS